ncbi:hypothetical protein CHUV2995_01268 [Corynebacterium diphtheriae subsp. lausannense]|nr:hypothetical protein CHUV2995_01268 [Corynebacterium diphtheriae subsp. lausannense]
MTPELGQVVCFNVGLKCGDKYKAKGHFLGYMAHSNLVFEIIIVLKYDL